MKAFKTHLLQNIILIIAGSLPVFFIGSSHNILLKIILITGVLVSKVSSREFEHGEYLPGIKTQ